MPVEVVVAHEELFGHVTDKKADYLRNVLSRWPVQRVIEGMRREHSQGATRRISAAV